MPIKIPQIEIEELKKELKNKKYKKILIQSAEGLIESIPQVMEYIDDNDSYEFFFDGEPCYGACDIPLYYKKLNIDCIIHLGHNDFGFKKKISDFPIIFLPVTIEIDVRRAVSDISKFIPNEWKNIGMATTVQHLKYLQLISELLLENNREKRFFIHQTGQILGCNYSNVRELDDIDGTILIAGGDFHAKQLPIYTKKPVLRYDPFALATKLFGKEYYNKFFAQRYAMITKAKLAKEWGILVSTKVGQLNIGQSNQASLLLKKNNLKSMIITAKNLDPNYLMNFTFVDAWVNTACPRLATDDYSRFNKPIISLEELKIVLGEKNWEEYIEEF